jgi:hypothetical protein
LLPLSSVTSSACPAWLGSMVLGTRRPHHTTAGRRMKHRHSSSRIKPANPRVAPQLVKFSLTSYSQRFLSLHSPSAA